MSRHGRQEHFAPSPAITAAVPWAQGRRRSASHATTMAGPGASGAALDDVHGPPAPRGFLEPQIQPIEASQLVAQSRAGDAIGYIESIASGFVG